MGILKIHENLCQSIVMEMQQVWIVTHRCPWTVQDLRQGYFFVITLDCKTSCFLMSKGTVLPLCGWPAGGWESKKPKVVFPQEFGMNNTVEIQIEVHLLGNLEKIGFGVWGVGGSVASFLMTIYSPNKGGTTEGGFLLSLYRITFVHQDFSSSGYPGQGT